jgi:hypothetical protein
MFKFLNYDNFFGINTETHKKYNQEKDVKPNTITSFIPSSENVEITNKSFSIEEDTLPGFHVDTGAHFTYRSKKRSHISPIVDMKLNEPEPVPLWTEDNEDNA